MWGYVSRTKTKPPATNIDDLEKWEESDAQALSTILMNITPDAQAGLDCTLAETAWNELLDRYSQADPIVKNLAHTQLLSKQFIEGGTETITTHLAELQKLREKCGGLGLNILDSQFTGIITLSMPLPSWDPVIGALGGMLDPKIIISHISTEWSRRQGLGVSTDKKSNNVVFQTGTRPSIKCNNCDKAGHTKTRCWAKDSGQEGQYPEWYKGKKDPKTSNTVKAVSDTQIGWAYGTRSIMDVWYADSAATVHVSPNHDDFTTYHKFKKSRAIKAFKSNEVEAIGEGDIFADVHYDSKTTRIQLTRVMHVPRANGKILSLKVLDQKGFES